MAEEAKEPSQIISFRVTDEVYGKLKAIAQAEGVSVGDLMKGLAEACAAGSTSSPVPPGPSPQPGPGPLPGEVAELRKWCEEIARREEELRVYTGALGRGMIEVETVVSRMWSALWPLAPLPPWGWYKGMGVEPGVFREKLANLEELRERSAKCEPPKL